MQTTGLEGRISIEVCVEGWQAAVAATMAGAHRIELNRSLDQDGLTPDLALCHQLRVALDVPIVAMLRPHSRSFVYDAIDRKRIFEDLDALGGSGIQAIAFGGLTESRNLDVRLMADVRKRAQGMQLVMHRAFDVVCDQLTTIDQLIDLGVDRVLTSGGQKTALDGAAQIRRCIERSRGQIEILPGAGINLFNAAQILSQTGCDQLHGTFRKALPDGRLFPDVEQIEKLCQLRKPIRPTSMF